MEGMGIKAFADVYKGRRVLVTGHTGFKGSWLSAWLSYLEADVTGIALTPDTTPSHYNLLRPDIVSHFQDIRDADTVAHLVRRTQPEIVFHLAAQPLVRKSYRDPLGTWSTNVMGTANVLQACRDVQSIRAIVVVTTDKCYENNDGDRAFREDDRLGGHDPYSASKAATEILCDSFRKSYFSEKGAALLATARAGNVIGGGDWSEDRLIPDLVRAVAAHRPLVIRSPKATRPWQHVLEPLAGYMMLGMRLLKNDASCATAWNFGPDDNSNRTVEQVLDAAKRMWPGMDWCLDTSVQPHEAKLLHLDSTKAHQQLGWHPVWNLEQALGATIGWYRQQMEHNNIITRQQIADYTAAMEKAGIPWMLAPRAPQSGLARMLQRFKKQA